MSFLTETAFAELMSYPGWSRSLFRSLDQQGVTRLSTPRRRLSIAQKSLAAEPEISPRATDAPDVLLDQAGSPRFSSDRQAGHPA